MGHPLPTEYIAFGTMTQKKDNVAGGAITKAVLTAAFAGNAKVLFANGLKELHLDFLYTPQVAQTTRYLEALIENLDEYDNVISKKSVVIPASTEQDVFTNRNLGNTIVIPGEKSEGAGLTISADFDCDINCYKVKVSVRENDTTGTPVSNFGAVFSMARFYAK